MEQQVRPIDANAMHKFVEESVAKGEGGFANGVPYEWAYALTAVDMQPTLDYAPVVHGEWGASEIVGYDGIHAVYAVPCSMCKEYTELYRARYCPNCGAKMDGGKKDGNQG